MRLRYIFSKQPSLYIVCRAVDSSLIHAFPASMVSCRRLLQRWPNSFPKVLWYSGCTQHIRRSMTTTTNVSMQKRVSRHAAYGLRTARLGAAKGVLMVGRLAFWRHPIDQQHKIGGDLNWCKGANYGPFYSLAGIWLAQVQALHSLPYD